MFPKIAPQPTQETTIPPTVLVPAAQTVPERAIIVAPMSPQLIPKRNASPGMCSDIAIAKYADGLPLDRLETILGRSGFDISRATMAAWMIRLGQLIVPLMNLMDEIQCGYDLLQMDEPTAGARRSRKSRMWVRRGGLSNREVPSRRPCR